MSTKFTPTAVWRTPARRGPGLPSGRGSHTSTSGPPDLWKRIALGMSRLLSGMSGHKKDFSKNLEVGPATLQTIKPPTAGNCSLICVSRPDIILPAEWYTEAAIRQPSIFDDIVSAHTDLRRPQ